MVDFVKSLFNEKSLSRSKKNSVMEYAASLPDRYKSALEDFNEKYHSKRACIHVWLFILAEKKERGQM